MKLLVMVSLLALSGINSASAAEYMSKDEVNSLMMNKTFDGIFLPKDKKFQAFEAEDGTHHVLRSNGKKDKNRTWSVNYKGQHCTTNPKWKKPRCSYVVDAGNGEYHKINKKGKHTHTLTNFRDGNQL